MKGIRQPRIKLAKGLNFKKLSAPHGGHEALLTPTQQAMSPEEQRAMFARLADAGRSGRKPRTRRPRPQAGPQQAAQALKGRRALAAMTDRLRPSPSGLS